MNNTVGFTTTELVRRRITPTLRDMQPMIFTQAVYTGAMHTDMAS